MAQKTLERFLNADSINTFKEFRTLYELLIQRIEEITNKIYKEYEGIPYIIHFLDLSDSLLPGYKEPFHIGRSVKYEVFERDRRKGKKRLVVIGEVQEDVSGHFLIKLAAEYPITGVNEPEPKINVAELMELFGGGGHKFSGGTRKGIEPRKGQSIQNLKEEISRMIRNYLSSKGVVDIIGTEMKKINELYEIARIILSEKSEKIKNIRYIILDKDAIPENQRYIIKPEEWNKRKQIFKKLFPELEILIVSGSDNRCLDDTGVKDISKDNCLIIGSESNMESLQRLNMKLLSVGVLQENQLFPLNRLILLGIKLLSLNDRDKNGSPLIASIQRVYRNITDTEFSMKLIKEFIEDPTKVKLIIIIPPAQKFNDSQLRELHGYSLEVLSSA